MFIFGTCLSHLNTILLSRYFEDMKRILLLCVASLSTLAIYAQTVTISPEKDNSIYSELVNNSAGLGYLYAGETCSGDVRRALFRFDIAGEVPAGATITGVTLTLNCNNVAPSATTKDFDLHALLEDWGEGTSVPGGAGGTGAPATAGDATWTQSFFGSSLWTAGGNFNPTASATTSIADLTGEYSWSSATMIAEVQAWLDAPASNFGWILKTDETSTCEARRWGSKDLGTVPELEVTYALPVSAACQNINAYLDASGSVTIDPADLDDGSTGTVDFFSSSDSTFDCSDIGGGGAGAPLIITGVIDGPLSGGTPKAVELYAVEDIPDLSLYGIGSANNGGGSDGVELTFPADAIAAGTFFYVATETPNFNAWFGFDPDYIDGTATNINGDDAIELFEGLTVIDVFGDIDTDGTGQPWEYLDGWAYRNDFTGPDDASFTIGNWSFSGTNELDGETDNASAAVPFPLGSYAAASSDGLSVQLYVNGAGGDIDSCTAIITVLDTLGPNMVCASPTIALDGSGLATITVADLDGGTDDNCSLDSVWSETVDVTCADIGTMDLWLYAVDVYGNTDSCMATVTIDGSAIFSLTLSQVGTNLTSDDAGAIYQWINCDSGDPIAGATDQSFTPATSGTYGCIVTVGTCSDTSECVSVSVGGLAESGLGEINVYPNPANDFITVSLSNFQNNIELSILDITGKEITSQQLTQELEKIDLSSFQEGVYLLQIRTSEGMVTKKFTVLK